MIFNVVTDNQRRWRWLKSSNNKVDDVDHGDDGDGDDVDGNR